MKVIGLELPDKIKLAYEALAFNQACETILSLVRASNKFIDEQAPWSLYKQGQQEKVEQVLYAVLESVRLTAYFLSPVIPDISTDIYQQLGFEINFNDSLLNLKAPINAHGTWGLLASGQILGKAKPIFKRIELPKSHSV